MFSIRPSDKTWGRIIRFTAVIGMPLAVLMSCTAMVNSFEANNKALPDVQKEVTINNNLRFFSTNFLTVYFGGSDQVDRKQLESMVTGDVPVELSSTPMTADFINVADVKTLVSGDELGLYAVTANVSLTAPGNGSQTRNTYTLEVVRSGATYAVAKLPSLGQYVSKRIDSSQQFIVESSASSPAGDAITNFVSAYYVSTNASSLGRFVTSGFDGEPIRDSPYTAIQVDRIRSERMLEGPGSPGNGESTTVLVTLRAVVTNSTFNLMQVMLKIEKNDGNWMVAEITNRVPINQVKARDPADISTTVDPVVGMPGGTPTLTDRPVTTEPTSTDTGSKGSDDDTTEPSR